MISYESARLDLVFDAIERLCGEAEPEDRGEIRVTRRDDDVIVSWLDREINAWVIYVGNYTRSKCLYRGMYECFYEDIFQFIDINPIVRAEGYDRELFWNHLEQVGMTNKGPNYPSSRWLKEKFPDTWREDNVITRELAIDYVFC